MQWRLLPPLTSFAPFSLISLAPVLGPSRLSLTLLLLPLPLTLSLSLSLSSLLNKAHAVPPSLAHSTHSFIPLAGP
ncbi:hypothetical protein EDD21DRAFT_24547 [Dissophora ornata]|nr:hypothetical protein EDD21DRAFT_24547 [Dissophora ornata]